MNLDEEKEKEIWESWLIPKYGDKLDQIKNAVKEIYDRNRQSHGDLPYFTPHGPEHCMAVEDLIHKIISGERYAKLSIKERFYLLASAWLHDLGMLPYVCSIVYKDEFPLSENEIRKRHHTTSEKYIVENWFDLKIDENDKELLGKLCKYHRRVEKLDPNDEEFLVGTESFRLTLLASYLRLADSLDIGASRTPSEPYAICLAYDIPEDAKLHWIKSKLVNGIDINADDHTITIQFKCPNPQDLEGIIDLHTATEKIDSIINLVTENLRDELASIYNIITRAEISYFLDIKTKRSNVGLDNQMLNDVRELVLNYDIMMAPSASKLIEIILATIANILGYALRKAENPLEFTKAQRNDQRSIQQKAQTFLISIEENIVRNRPCHFGITNLINRCKTVVNKVDTNFTIKQCVADINALYQDHQQSRQTIRANSKTFFDEAIPHEKEGLTFNLLLYGYSELATKAICGLRDLLIDRVYALKNPRSAYGSDLEKAVSEKIRIFVCEGQPKTQTTYNDRLIYHDGSQYAHYLSQRGFNNIIIIPDILAGTIMERMDIHFIILGANGVTREYFTHSAGHLSIVDLAIANRSSDARHHTKIVLVTSKEKYLPDGRLISETNARDDSTIVEGCLFSVIEGLPPNRNHVWLSRDLKQLDKLFKSQISFVNPREDRVSIDKIDVVISDTGFQPLSGVDSGESIAALFL